MTGGASSQRGLKAPHRIVSLVTQLLAHEPDDPAALQLRHAVEEVLMEALSRGGRAAGEDLVASLAPLGSALKRLDLLPCMWRLVLPPPRVLEIWFTGGEQPSVAALAYRIGAPSGGPAERRAAKLQAAFYARYGRGSAGSEGAGADDAVIDVIGELDADLHNGGFAQYLANKGRVRAREAHDVLRAIGARRTAAWLSAALEASADDTALEELTRQFNNRSEDLPSLVMRHLARLHAKGDVTR